jgi:hypothetical protein
MEFWVLVCVPGYLVLIVLASPSVGKQSCNWTLSSEGGIFETAQHGHVLVHAVDPGRRGNQTVGSPRLGRLAPLAKVGRRKLDCKRPVLQTLAGA